MSLIHKRPRSLSPGEVGVSPSSSSVGQYHHHQMKRRRLIPHASTADREFRAALSSSSSAPAAAPLNAVSMNVMSARAGRKRPRCDSEHSAADSVADTKYFPASDVEYLRQKHAETLSRVNSEFQNLKAEYEEKLFRASSENNRLAHERRVLKNGVVVLNAKREELANEIKSLRAVVDSQRAKIRTLEQTNFTLQMHIKEAMSGTRGSFPGGGGVC